MGLTRFGGDLLSHVLRRSTIGAAALNGRVRNGAGCFACAMTTKPRKTHMLQAACGSGRRKRPAKQVAGRHGSHAGCSISKSSMCRGCMLSVRNSLAVPGSDQAYRAISTGQLNALLRLHLRPIDVVVFHGPQGYLVLRGASRLDAFSGYPVRS